MGKRQICHTDRAQVGSFIDIKGVGEGKGERERERDVQREKEKEKGERSRQRFAFYRDRVQLALHTDMQGDIHSIRPSRGETRFVWMLTFLPSSFIKKKVTG